MIKWNWNSCRESILSKEGIMKGFQIKIIQDISEIESKHNLMIIVWLISNSPQKAI